MNFQLCWHLIQSIYKIDHSQFLKFQSFFFQLINTIQLWDDLPCTYGTYGSFYYYDLDRDDDWAQNVNGDLPINDCGDIQTLYPDFKVSNIGQLCGWSSKWMTTFNDSRHYPRANTMQATNSWRRKRTTSPQWEKHLANKCILTLRLLEIQTWVKH